MEVIEVQLKDSQNKSVSIPLLALSSASDWTSILEVLQFSVVPSISPISFLNHIVNASSVSNIVFPLNWMK